jgi:hypothetical protein
MKVVRDTFPCPWCATSVCICERLYDDFIAGQVSYMCPECDCMFFVTGQLNKVGYPHKEATQ